LEEKIIVAIIVSAIAFFSIYAFTPILIKFLEKRNLTVKDVNKIGDVMIPRPGGISIMIGIVASEIVISIFPNFRDFSHNNYINFGIFCGNNR